MSHKENKSHEEKASGFKKNDLILVLLVFVAAEKRRRCRNTD